MWSVDGALYIFQYIVVLDIEYSNIVATAMAKQYFVADAVLCCLCFILCHNFSETIMVSMYMRVNVRVLAIESEKMYWLMNSDDSLLVVSASMMNHVGLMVRWKLQSAYWHIPLTIIPKAYRQYL